MRPLCIVVWLLALGIASAQTPAKTSIPFSDARFLFDALRADIIPAELRNPADREQRWSEWIAQRDAAIRARVVEGDEDSLVHLLLFGTSFTRAPRADDRALAALVTAPAEGLTSLARRIDDFAAAVAAPGANERLQFARALIDRRGLDPATAGGRTELRRYLEERVARVGGSIQSSRLLDAATSTSDKQTIFRERGLSTDTSLFTDFGVEQALEAMKTTGVLRAGSIRRVAIVGPGLDFTDKLEGYDFYPEQTVQPFALVDSLLRLELAAPDDLSLVAFDLSPRVLRHLESARARARGGMAYNVVLPRNADRAWSSDLVDYWERFGNWIGEPLATVPPAPAAAGRVQVRGVAVRPSIVLLAATADLNVVSERLHALPADRFDLVVATNVLLYYDVFEQSLAATGIAAMLHPGGFLLTNNRIFELPGSPLAGAGSTDVVYMSLPGVGDAGDRFVWYRRGQ